MPTISTDADTRRREQRLRGKAQRQGYLLRKSRVRPPHLHDFGGYMLVNASTNIIEAGENFDLDLDDLERFGGAGIGVIRRRCD
jgi:hypothetical protein